MGLKLRCDEEERVVRSVGDPPNGILALARHPDTGEAAFAISSTWQPPQRPPDAVGPLIHERPFGSEHFQRVPVDEVFAGVQSGREAEAIWGIAVASLLHRAQLMGPVPRHLIEVYGSVELARAVFDELTRAGWLVEGEWQR